MSRKRYTPEQIIGLLREAEVLFSQGMTSAEMCRRLGVLEQSY
jgi:putative transposase